MRKVLKFTWFIPLTILLVVGCTPNQANPEGQALDRPDPFDQTASYDQANPHLPYQQRGAQPVRPYDARGHRPFVERDDVHPHAGYYGGVYPYTTDLPGPGTVAERQATRARDRHNLHNPGQIDTYRGAANHRSPGKIHGLGERRNQFNLGQANDEAEKVAQRLVKLATRIDGVNDATAVVVGNWAVVGIDVNAKMDRSKVGSIKYTVAEALKADPMGAYSIVTADIDTNYRLRQMRQDIQNGKPIEGIMDELAAIVGRIMPQVPRALPDPEDSPDEIDEQNTRLQRKANQGQGQS